MPATPPPGGSASVTLGAVQTALGSGATAVTNLGLGSAANSASTDFLAVGATTQAIVIAFRFGALPTADTVPVYLPAGSTITGIVKNVGSAGGSFVVKVAIGGVDVTGLAAVTVNSSSDSTTNATAANVLASAGRVDITFSSVSGSPNGYVILLYTR